MHENEEILVKVVRVPEPLPLESVNGILLFKAINSGKLVNMICKAKQDVLNMVTCPSKVVQ